MKRIKEHVAARKFHYLSGVLAVAAIFGVYASFLGGGAASASVSNVVGADTDVSGFGLDGRDVSVTWTTGSQPTNYQYTELYVVKDNITITTDTLFTACPGGNFGSCSALAFHDDYNNASFDLPEFQSTDSNGEAFIEGQNYLAYVYTYAYNNETFTDESTMTVSAAFQLTSDVVVDVDAPFIDCPPARKATESVDAYISCFIYDEQTAAAAFDTPVGSELFDLYYGADVSASASSVSASQVEGDLFEFVIPGAAVPAAGNTFEYYLMAVDNAGNQVFVCADPIAQTAADCQAAPFVVSTVSIGSRAISANISNADDFTSIDSPVMFIGGYAAQAATGDMFGAVNIANIPDNDVYDVVVYKSGFCNDNQPVTFNGSDEDFYMVNLRPGDCSGGTTPPHVVYSRPANYSEGVPTSDPIVVYFDQPMACASMIDQFGQAVGLSDDQFNNPTGQVTCCPDNSEGVCATYLAAGETNAMIFTPDSPLNADTNYSLELSGDVTSDAGIPLEGNLGGGVPGMPAHAITFRTTAGALAFDANNFGSGGAFIPPYVRSVIPAPGVEIAPNVSLLVEFNERMDSTTINTTNFTLVSLQDLSNVSLASVTLDTAERRFVTLTPSSNLAAGEYEVQVLGAVANQQGLTMLPPGEGSTLAFGSFFAVGSATDATAPTVYPYTADGSTGVGIGSALEFGFSEQLNPSTVTGVNVSLKKGTATVPVALVYNPGENTLTVVPETAMTPNSQYSIVFGAGITDLAGNAITEQSFSFTTGGLDIAAPTVLEVRCDDYECYVEYSEPMNNDNFNSSDYTGSVTNLSNYEITVNAGPNLVTMDSPVITYEPANNAARLQGFSSFTPGDVFSLKVYSGVQDLAGNGTGSDITMTGTVENSAETFGAFDGGAMFQGGILDGAAIGAAGFESEGFGNFTAEQHLFGTADFAFPFNPLAGADSNVFQIMTTLGSDVTLQDDDQLVFEFPNGTGLSGASLDRFSWTYGDHNDWAPGTVSTTALTIDGDARTITVTVDVDGSVSTSDPLTYEFRGITNPPVPKGFETGGYTVGIKQKRAGSTILNKTSMPYFIDEAGTNSITLNVYAGSQGSPDNVSGDVFLFCGGPSGPCDENLSVAAGTASKSLTSLPDGCYFFGTDSFVTLGANDYFGQFSPEPVCVDSSNSSATVNIVLDSASGGGVAADLTVKLAGIADFGGEDIDIFCGGPGRYITKTLSAVGTPAGAGYSVSLPENGHWYCGVDAAMAKGSVASAQTNNLAGVPPAPAELVVSGIGGSPAIGQGFDLPAGVSFDDANDELTFTFAAANKCVSGTVTDGTTGLANVEVFMHSQGFGQPTFTQTANDGTFTACVSDYGAYEIGAFTDGLPPVFKQIDILSDGNFYQGSQINGGNPLVLTMLKPDYTISGKVLDADSNGIAYAPVHCSDTDGNFFFGVAGSDGAYSLFVNGNTTYTCVAEVPADASDACGTFSKSIAVTTENKSNQNISQSTGTCYTLSGTVTIGGETKANVPVFVEEWDTASDRPSGGAFKGTATNGSGTYTAKVAAGTYRVGTWDPSYGEVGSTFVINADKTDAHLNPGALGTITFSFTGGTATQSAFCDVRGAADAKQGLASQFNDLSAAQTMSVPGGTYNYFCDVHGFGGFSGSVATGATATIDLSADTFITISGTVYDDSDAALARAFVVAVDSTNGEAFPTTADASGAYSLSLKAGTYCLNAELAGYIKQSACTDTAFAGDTTYDFGGATPTGAALGRASQTICGTLKDSGGTALTDGFVWAENTDGLVVSSPIDPDDGGFCVSVVDGTWNLKGMAPRHAETECQSGITIAGASQAGVSCQLTADATKVPASSNKSLDGSTGGSVDDTDDTGIKLTAGAGVLCSSDATISLEKNFTAPDGTNYDPVDNAAYGVNITCGSSVKDFNGSAQLQMSYDEDKLEEGVEEENLIGMYYSTDKGTYVECEGGSTVDTTNNIVTCNTTHATDFMVGQIAGGGGGGGEGGGNNNNNNNNNVNNSSPTANTILGAGKQGGINPPRAIATAIDPAGQETKAIFPEEDAPEVVTVGNATHTLTVTEIFEGRITLLIESEPVTVEMEKGDTADVDTNGDGFDDLRVVYVSLNEDTSIPQLSVTNLADDGELNRVMTINAGQYETDTRSVSILFNVTNTVSVALANTKDFEGSSFVSLESPMAWELTEGDGEKKVYARFLSEEGGSLEIVDTIMLVGQGFAQEVPEEELEEEAAEEDLLVDEGVDGCALTPGQAYKHTDSPAVWYITDGCTRRVFSNSRQFFSYFTAWDNVRVVPAATLQSIKADAITFMPWGPNYEAGRGALVKTITDPKIYVLLGSNRHWVSSEGVFNALKYAWEWVEDAAQELVDQYEEGEALTDEAGLHPEGTLLKADGSSKVYVLERNAETGELEKRWVVFGSHLEEEGYRTDRIITLDSLDQYPTGTPIQ